MMPLRDTNIGFAHAQLTLMSVKRDVSGVVPVTKSDRCADTTNDVQLISFQSFRETA